MSLVTKQESSVELTIDIPNGYSVEVMQGQSWAKPKRLRIKYSGRGTPEQAVKKLDNFVASIRNELKI